MNNLSTSEYGSRIYNEGTKITPPPIPSIPIRIPAENPTNKKIRTRISSFNLHLIAYHKQWGSQLRLKPFEIADQFLAVPLFFPLNLNTLQQTLI